jgi:hypothetical protein
MSSNELEKILFLLQRPDKPGAATEKKFGGGFAAPEPHGATP